MRGKDIFLVDADDTILDFYKASSNALVNAFVESGLGWKEEYAPLYSAFNDGLWEKLERKEITRTELIKTRFPLFLASLGLPDVGEAFNGYYLNHLATHPIYVEGAEAFLAELKKRGRVFIVTNGTEFIQKSRFRISGLGDSVDGVFISDTIGYDKPAKEYTDYVLSHIQDFDKERAVWIGDSLSADIKAANDAGIASIWFNRKGKSKNGKAEPDYEAASFSKILEILDEISG